MEVCGNKNRERRGEIEGEKKKRKESEEESGGPR